MSEARPCPTEWGPGYAGWFVLRSSPGALDERQGEGLAVQWTHHELEWRGGTARARGVCASGDVPGLVVPGDGPAKVGRDLSFLGGPVVYFR